MTGDDRGEVLRLLGRAEIDAVRLPVRRRAAAYADVALCAARADDEGRMARCLEQAERHRRNLPLLQQVKVCAVLCRASLAVEAHEFAQVMAAMATDCACRIRPLRSRREALQSCVVLYLELNQASRALHLLRALRQVSPDTETSLTLDVALALVREGKIADAIGLSESLGTENRAGVLVAAMEVCVIQGTEQTGHCAISGITDAGLRAVALDALTRGAVQNSSRRGAAGGCSLA
jgi:hypothetical protein